MSSHLFLEPLSLNQDLLSVSHSHTHIHYNYVSDLMFLFFSHIQTFPFFGVVPAIIDENGAELNGECEGFLVFKKPWPGIMRTVYGDHEHFERTYFQKFPGYYCTGDGRLTSLSFVVNEKA